MSFAINLWVLAFSTIYPYITRRDRKPKSVVYGVLYNSSTFFNLAVHLDNEQMVCFYRKILADQVNILPKTTLLDFPKLWPSRRLCENTNKFRYICLTRKQ